MAITTEMIRKLIYAKVYEPVASTRDRSVREMKFGPHHIRHRFPFAGGINIYQITQGANPFLEALRKAGHPCP